MRKRIISMILAIVLVLSLFPFAAVAAEGQDTAVLKLHTTWDDPIVDCNMQLPYSWTVQFHLHHADGSTELVDPEDLTLPKNLAITDTYEDGWFELQPLATGNNSITLTRDGETYSFPVTVELPNLGLYGSQPFTEGTLLDELMIDTEHTEFFIALSPELVKEGNYMTAVNTQFGPEVDDPSLTDIATITISQDGSYAIVKMNNLQAEGSYHFEATIRNTNHDHQFTWGRSLWVSNDMPGLYFCHVHRPEDVWMVDTENPQNMFDCPPGDSHFACFYFGTPSDIEAGKGLLLSAEDLSFPAFLSVSPLEDDRYPVPTNALDVQITRFANSNENTVITYTHNGTTYTLDVDTVLPTVGFYTEPVASEAAFIHAEDPFVVTEDNRTLYLCVSDTKNFRLTGINRWGDEELASLFTVTPSGDGSYIALTVKDGMTVSTGRYGIEIGFEMYQGDNNWRKESHGRALCLKNGQPSLMWRHMDWDDTTHTWVESDREFETRMIFRCGDEMPIQFYYGFEDDYKELSLADLTFPSNVMSAFMREGALWLRVTGYEESGFITYTKGDVTVQMPVTARQPDFGFYSTSTADESTFLDEEVSLGSVNDVVYIVTDGEQTIHGFERFFNHEFGVDATDCFDVQVAADGSYAAIKMKKNAEGELPFGGRYEVEIRTDWGIRYLHFDLIRADLPQLSTPTNLTWHRDYMWRTESANDYDTRMGNASWYGGELSQNRYDIEYYSSLDNYTTPVHEGSWGFGDMDELKYFSVPDLVYDDPESATYKFRVRARGDGTVYRDSEWSEFSPEFIYTAPANQLTAPDNADFAWGNWDNRYFSTWPLTKQEGAGYYEINWFHEDENGNRHQNHGVFDINIKEELKYNESRIIEIDVPDELFEQNGPVPYYFRVRVIPADMTQYRPSEWSDFSLALNMGDVTDQVNKNLADLLPTPSDPTNVPTVEDVQQALADQTADLRAAMAADQSVSGGQSSGTLDLIQELEKTVADNVDKKVEAKNSAPTEIKEIADSVEMIGATLNFADKNPDSGKTPTVTLEIDKPKDGIVIDEQQHNAVQFSMKLNGAIDKDDKREGQQLVVPIVIDMPVPSKINPDFLVVLHKLSTGRIEQIRPYIYLNETDNKVHARFVIDSFSDFAFLEYNVGFEADTVIKTVGDAAFTLVPVGQVEGAEVFFESSDPSVAEVDPFTGEVTIIGAGTVTITATIRAYQDYPEVTVSYTLIVNAAPSVPTPPPYDFPVIVPPVVTPPVQPVENPFTDVKEGAYYYDAVQWAVENGITGGMTPTAFGPDITCTRAQVVTFLWRALGCPEPVGTANAFSDVKAGTYYSKAVQWAIENGITAGTGDGSTFSPDAPCTRAQVVTFLWRAMDKPEANTSASFTDVKTGDYYTAAVQWAVENTITAGTGDGSTFSPANDCARAQVVTFLWRCLAK